jgi:hypothetical protein
MFADNFVKCIIRNTIQDFHILEREVTTKPKLLLITKNRKYIFTEAIKSVERVVIA